MNKTDTYWGFEIKVSPKEKILVAKKPLSVQKHVKKTEIWTALQDTYVTINDEFIILKPGMSVIIPKNTLHCLLYGSVLEEVDVDDDTIRLFDWCRDRK